MKKDEIITVKRGWEEGSGRHGNRKEGMGWLYIYREKTRLERRKWVDYREQTR